MTVSRGLGLLVFFAVLGVVTIGLRTEQARAASHIEQLQRQRVELRREAWALQMEISRLRTPAQVGERVERWALELSKPCPPSAKPGTTAMAEAKP